MLRRFSAPITAVIVVVVSISMAQEQKPGNQAVASPSGADKASAWDKQPMRGLQRPSLREYANYLTFPLHESGRPGLQGVVLFKAGIRVFRSMWTQMGTTLWATRPTNLRSP